MTVHADHERLDAWQKGMRALVQSYAIARCLPAHERYGLASQIRRAAVSVPANIAEAFGRTSSGDRLRFLAIAQGSNAELRTLLCAAALLGYIDASQLAAARELLEQTGQLVSGLRRFVSRQRNAAGANDAR